MKRLKPVGARLRRGAAASAHGAVRLVREALTIARRAGVSGHILVNRDSAHYQHAFVTGVTKAGPASQSVPGRHRGRREAPAHRRLRGPIVGNRTVSGR